jgi:hypothetical protein
VSIAIRRSSFGDALPQSGLAVIMRVDLPGATTDPAHRRGTRGPERREQVRISRADDLLLDAVVIGAPRAMGHPTMQTTVEPIGMGEKIVAEKKQRARGGQLHLGSPRMLDAVAGLPAPRR